MPINRRTLIALGLAFTLAATPAAAQTTQDLRSPDTRDAATLSQDLRSPDTRDLANHYAPVATVPVSTSVEDPGTGHGTVWMTAIAAGGYLLAVVIGAFALRSRGQRRVVA